MIICQQDMNGAVLQDLVIVVGSTIGPGHPKEVSFDEHSMESCLDGPICARVRPDPVRLCPTQQSHRPYQRGNVTVSRMLWTPDR